MQRFNHWPLSQTDMIGRFVSWEKVFKLKEAGFVFFYPFTEHSYQINYYLEWLETKKAKKPRIITILPANEDFYDFNLSDSDKKTGLLVDNAELLFTPDKERLLHELINFSKINETPVLFFAEILPIEYEQYVKKFSNTSYYKNLLNYPLHNRKNVGTFVKFIEKLLGMKIPKSLQEPIFKETGGYLWLIREIIRQIKNNKKTLSEIIKSEPYQYRTKLIWERLPQSVKDATIEFYRNSLTPETKILAFLRETRFLNNECPNELPNFLGRLLKEKLRSKLEVRNLHISLNALDISNHFSIYERKVLDLLVTRKDTVISRDEIAKARWGDSWPDKYSDWAIDQSMYRLKKKLSSQDKTVHINSYRKKGYGISW